MPLVTVFSTFNPAEAQLVRSRLDAAGFMVNVAHEVPAFSMEGYALAAGGIWVQVPSDQAEDAKALLNSSDDSGP